MQNNNITLSTDNLYAMLRILNDSALSPQMQANVSAAINELELAVNGHHILPKAANKFVLDLQTYDKYFP